MQLATIFIYLVVQGDNVKSELLSLLDELPEIYKGITAVVSSLKNTTHFYETFVNFLVPRFVECSSHFLSLFDGYVKVMDSILMQNNWNQLLVLESFRIN